MVRKKMEDDQQVKGTYLPKKSELSAEQLGFLEEHFGNQIDVRVKAPHLVAQLQEHCTDLDGNLVKLSRNFTRLAVSWISRSFAAKTVLVNLNLKLDRLGLFTSQYGSCSKKFRIVLEEELPQFARQLRRIETIRSYFETTLELEALVGDVEDLVLCVLNNQMGNMFAAKPSNSSVSGPGPNPEKLVQAVKAMNDIEGTLVDIVKFKPHWNQLLISVDARIDKILAVFRPRVFADYRALLASMGWPPKLSTSQVETEQTSGPTNPLVSIRGETRKSFCHSFIALCSLEHLQTSRERRQRNQQGQECCNIRLWAVDELVSPISSRIEYHFSKWDDWPELMFALVYRITNNFIGGIDDLLQPLIDRARLASYSAKEAWVSAMVQDLSTFLCKRFFFSLAERYKDKHQKPEVITMWLHLISLMVGFDKRIQSLVNEGQFSNLTEFKMSEGVSGGSISVLAIFRDRPDWLKIWAKIELKNARKRLRTELKNELAWLIGSKNGAEFYVDTDSEQYLFSTREDHKAPLIAEFALSTAWEMIERCRTMPSIFSCIRFIRLTASRFLWYFSEVLHLRCKRTQFSPDNPEDDAFIRACSSINAASYVESKLLEWSDGVNFLEMSIAENDSNHRNVEEDQGIDCFFGEEIKSLCELQTNWLMEIIALLLRQFETLSWKYIQIPKLFEQDLKHLNPVKILVATNLSVSADFVVPLDALGSKLNVLKTCLNSKDFLDLWRSIADGLDRFISSSILAREIPFPNRGAEQFEMDMQALFSVFNRFCARPQAFFPCIEETLNVLRNTRSL